MVMTSTSYNNFPKSWVLASIKVVKDTSSDLGKAMEKLTAKGAGKSLSKGFLRSDLFKREGTQIRGYEHRSLSGDFLRSRSRSVSSKSVAVRVRGACRRQASRSRSVFEGEEKASELRWFLRKLRFSKD